MSRILRAIVASLLALTAFSFSASARAQGVGGSAASQVTAPQVYVVPLANGIGPEAIALTQRALREAEAGGIRAVVLDLDTARGTIEDLRDIEGLVRAVLDRDSVPVLAYVRRQAFSDGAWLALTATECHLSPGARIGAMALDTTQTEIDRHPKDVAHDPADYAAMRETVRALLEKRGGYSERALRLVEGMVDPTLRLLDVVFEDEDGFQQQATKTTAEVEALRAQGIAVQVVEEYDWPLVLDAEQALRAGIALSNPSSLESLIRERFDITMDAVKIVESSWSERAAGWIHTFSSLLMIAGFLLLIVELKSPGFALPGVLGLLLLGTALFGAFLTGLAQWTDILLLAGGFGLLAVEFLLLPGLLLPGVAGFLCIVLGLVLSQQSFGWPTVPWEEQIMLDNLWRTAFIIGSLMVGSILLWRFLPGIPLFARVLQGPPDGDPTGGATQLGREDRAARLASLVGRAGVAATDLRPAGIVEVGGERLDVVAEDGWVSRGSAVVVQAIEGNRIVVAVAAEGAR